MAGFLLMERARSREVQIAFRTSKARRDQIRQRAADAGVSLQGYLEAVALGLPFAPERPVGRPRLPRGTDEELPLTG